MKRSPRLLHYGPLWALLSLLLLAACAANPAVPQRPKGTFVVVHGGWGGSYAWRPYETALRDAGYVVYRPTLFGTGETVHLMSPDIGLEVHIQQIVNLIRYEDLRDVQLIGYSYSGMVVTGVADRIPDRIGRLILVDAFFPVDGESTFSFVDGMHSPMAQDMLKEIGSADRSGLVPAFWEKPEAPPPKQDPQPYKTLVDKITLHTPTATGVQGAFIQFVPPGTAPDQADFAKSAARARARGWPVVILPGDHSAPFHSPGPITREILRLAGPE